MGVRGKGEGSPSPEGFMDETWLQAVWFSEVKL